MRETCLTFRDFKMSVLRSERPDRIRPGQQAFNLLYELRPWLANEIRGVYGVDPFYNHTFLPEFWRVVEARWEESPPEEATS